MKKLLVILGLVALATIARAQGVTNVTVNLLIEEWGVRTNTLSWSFSDLHVLGCQLAWTANIGNTNSFRNQVKNETKDRLESLRTEGRAYQLKTNKIDSILTSIQANWDNASAADRKLLTDWLAKYPAQ